MIKHPIDYLLLSLVCFSMVACNSLVLEGQGAPAVNQAGAAEITAVDIKENDPPATSTTTATPEITPVETKVVTPTATTDTRSLTEELPQAEDVSEESLYAQKMGETVGDEGALTYRNENFGFQLTLPPTWKGYQTTENIYSIGHLPDAGSVCFTFDDHMPLCVLKIDVWTKTAWAAQDWVPDGYYLRENETFVFAAGPYQSECVQLDEFQCERRQEVPAILAGMRVET